MSKKSLESTHSNTESVARTMNSIKSGAKKLFSKSKGKDSTTVPNKTAKPTKTYESAAQYLALK